MHIDNINYREAFTACNGILFNHESPRGETFVTKKIKFMQN